MVLITIGRVKGRQTEVVVAKTAIVGIGRLVTKIIKKNVAAGDIAIAIAVGGHAIHVMDFLFVFSSHHDAAQNRVTKS